jgi:type IV pilus assembly protein PilX
VGLVLLLVLTVVGVSGMNTATMEITMAANTQFQQDAFQLAEDGIETAIGTRAYATDAARTIDWLNGGVAPDRRAVTTYRMNTPAPGSSVGELEAFHFDTTSVGRGPRNAVSQHTQSFYVIGRAL